MLSSGGTARAAEAAARPLSTVLSGPAAGVIGAQLSARAAGFEDLITFDMGGTSCDVALVPGEPLRTMETELDGVPLRFPLIDLHTVGAGGGSIAWIDQAGALRVGPRSAGAVPGPASYAAGGEEATLTDAHIVLGHIDPARFLGGRRALDPSLAVRAIERLARAAGAAPIATAGAVVAVSRGHLERAVRRVTLARGHDPADFTLVAFGGAGGLHAAGLADALGCRSVMVPRSAGVLSALGCLAADVRFDLSRAVLEPAATGAERLTRWLDDLSTEADAALAREGIPVERRRMIRSFAMRYPGQSYELDVVAEGEDAPAAFHALHEERHGYARRDAAVEVVAARVVAVGLGLRPALPLHVPSERTEPVRRSVWIDGQELEAEAWIWGAAPAGHTAAGPAVVFDDYATVLIPPGWTWRVDRFGNLILAKLA